MSTASEKLHINVPLRAMMFFGLGISFFFIIALRLWYLQVIHGGEFRIQAENNRRRTFFVPPARGVILDRNGHILVKNRPSFNIEFITEDSPDPEATIEELSQIVHVPSKDLIKRLAENGKRRRFEPKILVRDVDRDLLAKVASQKYRLPGVIINVVPTREYVHGTLAAHVLGYIGEISGEQLERRKSDGYMIGDIVGKYGVEGIMEKDLQGKRGRQEIIVDATGNRIDIDKDSSEPDAPGHAVSLSIDYEVQQAAETAMDGKKGAVVALDPNTGEVLALVSHPAFDPNMFTHQVSQQDLTDLYSGKEKKLRDRAIQDTYAPGSVFKIFMSVAGLATGEITPNWKATCPGSYRFGGRDFHCWKKTGHGVVDLHSAIVQSCDVFFYNLGHKLEIDAISKYAMLFGLGEKTGIELDSEEAGVMPSREWKHKAKHERWYPGETISVSIGQGYIAITPMQIARGLAAIVNGGKVFVPTVVKRVQSKDGTFSDEIKPNLLRQLDIKPELLEIVKEGMAGVVGDPRGTGHNASLKKEFGIDVGGKTGTAQVAALQLHKKGTATDDHAWFAGYAPVNNPQIVTVALVENGGHGGSAAAPVVKLAMEAFFDKRMPRLTPKETPVPQSQLPKTNDVPEEHDRAD